ncbi:hypothetical protein M5K25_005470 [Dendrobium thyrsiflorum]|uniref:Uncharacterized protein n=1 Tax=Dendrobium thyrsiflorum TaxID=117978 RepID=A0ABD0VI21_DENTH
MEERVSFMETRMEERVSSMETWMENRFENMEGVMRKLIEMQSKAPPASPRADPKEKRLQEDKDEIGIVQALRFRQNPEFPVTGIGTVTVGIVDQFGISEFCRKNQHSVFLPADCRTVAEFIVAGELLHSKAENLQSVFKLYWKEWPNGISGKVWEKLSAHSGRQKLKWDKRVPIRKLHDIMTERDEGQSSQPIRISEDPENVAPVGGSAPSIDPTPVGTNDMNVMSGNMMQLQMMNMMMQMMEKMQSMVGSAAPGVPPVVTPVTPTTPGSSINVETEFPVTGIGTVTVGIVDQFGISEFCRKNQHSVFLPADCRTVAEFIVAVAFGRGIRWQWL